MDIPKQKINTFGLLPWSPYLLAYFVIFLVLWETKGMSDPNQHDFPFATFFLTSVFVVLLGSLFIKRKTPNIVHENTLRAVLLAQFIFFWFGNFSPHHYIFRYTTETSHLVIFHTLFYLSFILFVLSCFIKSYNIYLQKGLLFAAALFSICVIYCSIVAGIDTHLFLNMASDYFIDLKNPYSYTYPDIYNGEFTEVYGDKYYFNYWPMPLYICSIFRVLFNDVRYAFVFAQLIFVYILIRSRKNLSLQKTLLICTLWLLNLVVLYVNERSWLDALVAPFFISSLLLLQRSKYIWAGILVGLMASLKLYYVFALPFYAIYFLREKKIKEIFIIGIAFAATFVPFAIISFNDLYQSTIVFINSTKIREDSLSVVSAVKRIFDTDISFIGFLVMFSFMGIFYVLYFRSKNNILNLVKYINLTFFVIFLCSKQSFCNYFYFNMLCAFIIFYLESNYVYEEKK